MEGMSLTTTTCSGSTWQKLASFSMTEGSSSRSQRQAICIVSPLFVLTLSWKTYQIRNHTVASYRLDGVLCGLRFLLSMDDGHI